MILWRGLAINELSEAQLRSALKDALRYVSEADVQVAHDATYVSFASGLLFGSLFAIAGFAIGARLF